MRFAAKTIAGLGRGRELGFPTINLAIPAHLDLAPGVYAARANGMPAALFRGERVTMGIAGPTLELHVLDTELEENPSEIAVEVVDKIRNQKKFGNLEELQMQITADCEAVDELLN